MIPLITSAFSLLGSAVGGLFQFKSSQTDIVKQSIAVLSDVTTTSAQRDAATAAMLTANNQGWLANNARPLVFLVFAGLVVARFFGLESSYMSEADSEMVNTITLLYMGYFPAMRTIDKVVVAITNSGIIKTIIDKRIL
jgi:hypothetical protein